MYYYAITVKFGTGQFTIIVIIINKKLDVLWLFQKIVEFFLHHTFLQSVFVWKLQSGTDGTYL